MLYFIIATIFLMAISCLSTLQLEAKIEINNRTNYSFFIVRLFRGLIRFRFNISLAALEEGAISLVLRKTDSKLEHYAKIEQILIFALKRYREYTKYEDGINYLASKITIQNFGLNINIGLGDAAQTALITGSIATILHSLNKYYQKRLKLKSSQIHLLPHFNDRRFDLALDCIFHVKLGHIIIVVIRMLMHSIKGGDVSGRTSY